jgi:uncharacterized ferritin-like protein (DUF455 family)
VQLHSFARSILEADTVDAKLRSPPTEIHDDSPGPAELFRRPVRPPVLTFPEGTGPRVPPIEGMHDVLQRGRIIHALANHEFQAVELFAWAILAFPESPPEFRRGLLGILQDEQRHTRMYLSRLNALGIDFGDHPVNGYFWKKVDSVKSPIEFICMMSLTFENANLDHTIEYSQAARDVGDHLTAALIEKIHDDEITHVRFGWHWLREFKRTDQSMTGAYETGVHWPLRAALARGKEFHPDGRRAAGLDEDFIELLGRPIEGQEEETR